MAGFLDAVERFALSVLFLISVSFYYLCKIGGGNSRLCGEHSLSETDSAIRDGV